MNSKLFDAIDRGDLSEVKEVLSHKPSSEILEFRGAVRIFFQDIYDVLRQLDFTSLQ